MSKLDNLPERDRLLAERLAATLEQASARPDPALERALAAARMKAQEQGAARRPGATWLWASGMALAAGLAMVFVLPAGAPTPVLAPAKTLTAPVAKAVAPIDDPEMLDNLEMLQALSASDSHVNKKS